MSLSCNYNDDGAEQGAILVTMEAYMSQYICVVVEIATERCIGVDFCKDLPALRKKAAMYRADVGSECIVLEHPPQEVDVLIGLAELTAVRRVEP